MGAFRDVGDRVVVGGKWLDCFEDHWLRVGLCAGFEAAAADLMREAGEAFKAGNDSLANTLRTAGRQLQQTARGERRRLEETQKALDEADLGCEAFEAEGEQT